MADISQELRVVEALLFAATEPVSEDFLSERLPEGTDILEILSEIGVLYQGHGVTLARVAGKWSLRTAEDLSPHLRIERKVTRKPSRAAIESLAIIAYHQPVTRSEVEEIRGVSVSKGSFDVLLEAGWIKPVGRRRSPGRPTTWGTAQSFLEEFGLDSLADLPGIDELKASGLLDTRPAGTIIGDKGEFYNDAEAEGAPEEEDEPLDPDDGEPVDGENANEQAETAADDAEVTGERREADDGAAASEDEESFDAGDGDPVDDENADDEAEVTAEADEGDDAPGDDVEELDGEADPDDLDEDEPQAVGQS